MKNAFGLLVWAYLLASCQLAVYPRPAAAYIHFPRPTLGALCAMSHNIYVLRIEKASVQKGIILFKVTHHVKGKHEVTTTKQVIGPKTEGAKVISVWAAAGKRAVLFTINGTSREDGRELAYGHVYINKCWYSVAYDAKEKRWLVTNIVPTLLTRYCGAPHKLRDAVVDILRDKEVVVPCMVNGNKEDLEQGRAKVHRLRASLKLQDYDPKRDFVAWRAEEK